MSRARLPEHFYFVIQAAIEGLVWQWARWRSSAMSGSRASEIDRYAAVDYG
jgi:hypothetical protein